MDKWNQEIINKHPVLFRNAQIDEDTGERRFSFECDKGWATLLDVLCSYLTHRHDSLISSIEYNEKIGKDSEPLQKELDETDWPSVEQIKEKFGTLRFYTNSITDEQHAYVAFAETMSGHICEVCGNSGVPRGGGWIRTLCDEHTK